jgi:hypothetical protein
MGARKRGYFLHENSAQQPIVVKVCGGVAFTVRMTVVNARNMTSTPPASRRPCRITDQLSSCRTASGYFAFQHPSKRLAFGPIHSEYRESISRKLSLADRISTQNRSLKKS